MENILHITNGDGAASLLKASKLGGDVLPWRDIMQSGPFPKGLSLEEHSKLRAEFLSGPLLPIEQVQRDFALRDAHLKASPNYEEVILWFEHDVLDQLQILQLLAWFKEAELKQTKLSIICINQFEGIAPFRGLGQLTIDQIETLLPIKKEITIKQLDLGREGWQAFCHDDPAKLEAYIAQDLSALPFLKEALKRHLEEYPSVQNGLNKSQNLILRLVNEGFVNPSLNFLEFMEQETVFFMGDWTHFKDIGCLCNGEDPLLTCSPNGTFHYPPDFEVEREQFNLQELSLTKKGRKVFENKGDAVNLIKLDKWLGGVRLDHKKALWRWDIVEKKLVRTEPVE